MAQTRLKANPADADADAGASQAKAAYERFVAKKNANPNNVEAARQSLAKLS